MLHSGDMLTPKHHPAVELPDNTHQKLITDVWKDWQTTGMFFKPAFPGLFSENIKPKAVEQLKPAERLTLDNNGQPAKFNDRNDDQIALRADGKWYRTNIISPAGEELADFKVDKNGDIAITYQMPKDENDLAKGKD